MRAMQKLDEAREKLEETNKEFDNARRKAKQAKMAFERYKNVISIYALVAVIEMSILYLSYSKNDVKYFSTILNFTILSQLLNMV